ncbi:MAG: tyrosine-type recombinase/integrase [Gemmatimonadetes bacterium]|nr:tyrosine-type recombinase/integrase [Gemmatimonadota bacterium]
MMLSDYFGNGRAKDRLQGSAAGPYLDDFSEWLAGRGYRASTIESYLKAAARFAAWSLATAGIGPPELHRAHCAYRAAVDHATQRRSLSRRGPGNRYCGARTFVRFLRARGDAVAEPNATPVLLQRFQHWMRQDRGAAAVTLAGYTRVLRTLLATVGEDTHAYTASQLRAFVLQEAQGWSHSKAETAVSAVRMFVRFLLAHQMCSAGLEHAIPRVAGWGQATLPRYLSPEEVAQVLAACDPATPLGARDHAVLLLLARLGLRAGDVAGLRLPDLDWAEGCLRVTGKTRREAWLPLPQDVGEAILHYLQTARPAVLHDGVFLITRAPYTSILSRQVSSTAERAIRRAGIASPSLGAHVFRHSAATQWVRDGLSFQTIGSLLRHVDADTTAVYAKVDITRLQRIALPWPEEEQPC